MDYFSITHHQKFIHSSLIFLETRNSSTYYQNLHSKDEILAVVMLSTIFV